MSELLAARRSRRGISLTALIDVVFILLMFFMLTSSFSRFGFLEFNSATAGGSGSGTSESQVLMLQIDGSLVDLKARKVLLDDARLVSLMDPARTLTLRPAAEADVQTMVQAIERLNRLGLTQVTLGSAMPVSNP